MFDLHSHSICSDGSETPEAVVSIALKAGADLFALTDHDCVDGVDAAMRHAANIGLPMLTGTETEAEYHSTLHILGLGMDIHEFGFEKLMKKQEQCREERNEKLEKRLREVGMDVSPTLERSMFCTTRANFAAALVKAGYAADMDDAFNRIVGKGGIAYIKQEHPSPKEIISAINNAGGVAVAAHPMKMQCDPRALIAELAELGLWGVEAYYYSATPGETRLFSSLARQHGLFVTCGSDFHGSRRPAAKIGCCYKECDDLKRTRAAINKRFNV
ncbi:MAG: PHP domain-containing protein [Christensenellaceae bacterium]|nr:PHP domain-containing protein [Christensenellaceae bacterium]